MSKFLESVFVKAMNKTSRQAAFRLKAYDELLDTVTPPSGGVLGVVITSPGRGENLLKTTVGQGGECSGTTSMGDNRRSS